MEYWTEVGFLTISDVTNYLHRPHLLKPYRLRLSVCIILHGEAQTLNQSHTKKTDPLTAEVILYHMSWLLWSTVEYGFSSISTPLRHSWWRNTGVLIAVLSGCPACFQNPSLNLPHLCFSLEPHETSSICLCVGVLEQPVISVYLSLLFMHPGWWWLGGGGAQ